MGQGVGFVFERGPCNQGVGFVFERGGPCNQGGWVCV